MINGQSHCEYLDGLDRFHSKLVVTEEPIPGHRPDRDGPNDHLSRPPCQVLRPAGPSGARRSCSHKYTYIHL